LQAKDAAFKELQESLTTNARALEDQLSEKNELLKGHEAELEALREQLTQSGSAKDEMESLLQEEVRKKTELLETTDSAIRELEESISKTVYALENQLTEQDSLLRSRDAELAALRSELNSMTRPVYRSPAANERQTDESIGRELEETLRRVEALESQLSEKDKLINIRDRQIEKIATELVEKKTLLAKEERAVWRSIERRSAWKQRLHKIGINLKD
jgi:chromosome segregation ATPase